jgi:hypothetical protein
MAMDYAKFAIIFWIIATIIIAIVGKRSIFKQFGIRQNQLRWAGWKMVLFCAMAIGAVISIGITFIIKSLS